MCVCRQLCALKPGRPMMYVCARVCARIRLRLFAFSECLCVRARVRVHVRVSVCVCIYAHASVGAHACLTKLTFV